MTTKENSESPIFKLSIYAVALNVILLGAMRPDPVVVLVGIGLALVNLRIGYLRFLDRAEDGSDLISK